MTKVNIRARMKAFLAGMSAEERHARSLAACELLAGTKAFKNAQMIMTFMSMPTEIETTTLAVRAWTEGKSIAVPRVDWGGKRMAPVEVTSLETGMQTTQFGIREPIDGQVVPLDLIDVVVIPGMAFDRRGFRVGRGRGFYDRFLAQRDFQGVRCALCYHEQLIDHVPSEPHDVPMDMIVTDREVIYCSGAATPVTRAPAG